MLVILERRVLSNADMCVFIIGWYWFGYEPLAYVGPLVDGPIDVVLVGTCLQLGSL